MDIKFQVAERLRELRRERGWTQETVAMRLGISIPAVSKLETGVTDINFSRLQQLADVYRLPVTTLLGGETQPAKQTSPKLEAARRKLAGYNDEAVSLHRKIAALFEELHGMHERR